MFSHDLAHFGPDATPPAADAGRKPAILPAAGPCGTTRISRSPAGSFRAGCGSTSAISTPTAAGPTTWPTKPAIRNAVSRCWIGGRSCFGSATWARRRIPYSSHCLRPSRQFDIPIEPFIDLLVAFRQDQQVTRYETIEQLLGYCRYSANPVGRMVLYLGQCHTSERARLADSICTGLQLANFWQDVARDWDRGRVYLPQADCRRFGYDEASFARRECNEAFRRTVGLPRRGRREPPSRRLAAGAGDAPRVATAGGIVRGGRVGYAESDPPAAIRRLDAPPDGFTSRKTPLAARLLVEAAFRCSWSVG